MKSPCISCPDRFPACHDTCAKFFSWKSWDKLRKTRPDDGGATEFSVKNVRKRHKAHMHMTGGKMR